MKDKQQSLIFQKAKILFSILFVFVYFFQMNNFKSKIYINILR